MLKGGEIGEEVHSMGKVTNIKIIRHLKHNFS